MTGRERIAALFAVAMVAALVLVGVLVFVECSRCERTSETFAPIQTWWNTAGVVTMTDDVQAVIRALAGGPTDLAPACQRLADHTKEALAREPAPDEILQQQYHDTADRLRLMAEGCAGGDFYAIRPMVSDGGLSSVTRRYDEFRYAEKDRKTECNPS
ncbi:MAG: hypothetical protein QOJ69_734 [Actinomycetota bacterium]|nr:hypothetical protein [Actinomycetota bacterium]